MNPIILFPLSLCILSSCSLSDWQAQTTATPVVQTVGTVAITDTSTTTQVLREAYQEELLAEAIYRDIVATYPALASITNIVNSEEQHSTQVGRLLTARGIALPTDFGIYTDTYTTLKALVDSSLTGAIEVGIMVETGDIDHLQSRPKRSLMLMFVKYLRTLVVVVSITSVHSSDSQNSITTLLLQTIADI